MSGRVQGLKPGSLDLKKDFVTARLSLTCRLTRWRKQFATTVEVSRFVRPL